MVSGKEENAKKCHNWIYLELIKIYWSNNNKNNNNKRLITNIILFCDIYLLEKLRDNSMELNWRWDHKMVTEKEKRKDDKSPDQGLKDSRTQATFYEGYFSINSTGTSQSYNKIIIINKQTD